MHCVERVGASITKHVGSTIHHVTPVAAKGGPITALHPFLLHLKRDGLQQRYELHAECVGGVERFECILRSIEGSNDVRYVGIHPVLCFDRRKEESRANSVAIMITI